MGGLFNNTIAKALQCGRFGGVNGLPLLRQRGNSKFACGNAMYHATKSEVEQRLPPSPEEELTFHFKREAVQPRYSWDVAFRAARAFSVGNLNNNMVTYNLTFKVKHLKGKELKKKVRSKAIVPRYCLVPHQFKKPQRQLNIYCDDEMAKIALDTGANRVLSFDDMCNLRDRTAVKIRGKKNLIGVQKTLLKTLTPDFKRALKGKFPSVKNGLVFEDDEFGKQIHNMLYRTVIKCGTDGIIVVKAGEFWMTDEQIEENVRFLVSEVQQHGVDNDCGSGWIESCALSGPELPFIPLENVETV
eukprot:Nk52_evm66s62 gene=Nk52_evmTU66s62